MANSWRLTRISLLSCWYSAVLATSLAGQSSLPGFGLVPHRGARSNEEMVHGGIGHKAGPVHVLLEETDLPSSHRVFSSAWQPSVRSRGGRTLKIILGAAIGGGVGFYLGHQLRNEFAADRSASEAPVIVISGIGAGIGALIAYSLTRH